MSTDKGPPEIGYMKAGTRDVCVCMGADPSGVCENKTAAVRNDPKLLMVASTSIEIKRTSGGSEADGICHQVQWPGPDAATGVPAPHHTVRTELRMVTR
jgi:hypothetical protein